MLKALMTFAKCVTSSLTSSRNPCGVLPATSKPGAQNERANLDLRQNFDDRSPAPVRQRQVLGRLEPAGVRLKPAMSRHSRLHFFLMLSSSPEPA
jgi:hypothetical protein